MIELAGALRADLTAAGYTASALPGLWGPAPDAALRRGSTVAAARALDAGSGRGTALAALAALFVLGRPLPVAEVAAALPTLGIAGAVELGLVEAPGDTVLSAVELRPHELMDSDGVTEWWIVSDPGEAMTGRPLREDHVLGVGGASRTLLGLQLPRRVRTVLDLGTGCGIQALRAARWADRVVATDISERALRYARLNAAVNGVSTIDFRLGSLFEPVAGERFDRIVSNPPFVITPRHDGIPAYEYRDGGLEGDALVEAVMRGAAGHLAPGGVAQLLANWEDRRERDGIDRVAGWADAAGVEIWAVERDVQDPVQYAETWIRDGGILPGTPDFDVLLRAWLDDFLGRGVHAVGFGFVTLRRPRRGRAALRRLERLHGPAGVSPGGLGEHLAACLDAVDWLTDRDDAAVLAAHLVAAPDVTEERHYWPGDEHPAAMRLKQGGGFARELPLDPALAGLVGTCDGELSVGAIVRALATLLEVDETALAAELLPQVRELVATGFLLPA
ncbi:MAG: SAM-dependent methyltransferase [Naasia sp.]|uniref:DUF7059 domain-containing protein n=1 Tax=Naasia sp. TaxID=2546198 RepID=UPI0026334603|nr:methyltransferase [Naasia sp.]MCU1571084.1 SAM-dependent methyltransferase [Naasia sp.]